MLNSLALTLVCTLVAQAGDLTPSPTSLRREGFQSDFPALAVDVQGTPWIAYIERKGMLVQG